MKKVLIVGLGSIGKKHLNAALNLKCQIDVISKHTVNSENFQLIKNLTHDKTYDLGIICSVTSSHISDLLKIHKYCRTILVEKPIYHKKISPQLKLRLDKINSLIILGFNLRYLEILIFLKKYLINKKIIKVENVFWDDSRKWYAGRDFEKLYVSNKSLGGGSLLTNIHELDYVKFICNSEIIKLKKSFQKNKDYEVDESCIVEGFLENGTSFKSSLNIFSSVRERKGFILTSNEKIKWNLDKGIVTSNTSGLIFNNKTNYIKSYTDQLKYILENKFDNVSSLESNIKLNNLIF